MRKEDAKRLIDDTVLKESFGLLREKLHRDFENTDPLDKESLQLVRLKFELMREYYQELMKVINDSTIKEFEKRK